MLLVISLRFFFNVLAYFVFRSYCQTLLVLFGLSDRTDQLFPLTCCYKEKRQKLLRWTGSDMSRRVRLNYCIGENTTIIIRQFDLAVEG